MASTTECRSPHRPNQAGPADPLVTGDQRHVEAHGARRDQAIERVDETGEPACFPDVVPPEGFEWETGEPADQRMPLLEVHPHRDATSLEQQEDFEEADDGYVDAVTLPLSAPEDACRTGTQIGESTAREQHEGVCVGDVRHFTADAGGGVTARASHRAQSATALRDGGSRRSAPSGCTSPSTCPRATFRIWRAHPAGSDGHT